jgi:SPP1 gp7 family putative phage head morphogenesis protein
MDITPEQKEQIEEGFNKLMTSDMEDWKKEQLDRLRVMTTKMFEEGLDGQSLRELIINEWEVSENKAKFLSRNSTSIFLSEFRKSQSIKAGVAKYRWSASGGASGDGRTRDRHRHLHGKVFAFGNPPVTDDLGNRHEPGEDYNCRCVAIPVLD